jgi:hypothetical protein
MRFAKNLPFGLLVISLFFCGCEKEQPEPVAPNYYYYYDAIFSQEHRALVMHIPQLGLEIAGDDSAVLSIHAELFYRIDLRKLTTQAVTYDENQCTFRIPPAHFRTNILFNKVRLTFTGEDKRAFKISSTALRDYLPEIYRQFENSLSDEKKEEMLLETQQLAVHYLSKACRIGAASRREAIVITDPELYRTSATSTTE